MVDVTNTPLLEGHTFPDKATLLVRIAEEGNIYGVWIKICKRETNVVAMIRC
jgi:hypothetical protein